MTRVKDDDVDGEGSNDKNNDFEDDNDDVDDGDFEDDVQENSAF